MDPDQGLLIMNYPGTFNGNGSSYSVIAISDGTAPAHFDVGVARMEILLILNCHHNACLQPYRLQINLGNPAEDKQV